MNSKQILNFLQKYKITVIWNNPDEVADQCICELQQEGWIPYGDGDWGTCWNCFGKDLTDAVNNAMLDETLKEPDVWEK